MGNVNRIGTNTIPDNGIFHLSNREYAMDKVNNQINTGKKHRLPREGVVDVTQSMTFHTKIHKINQFLRTITDAESERSLVEVKTMDTINIMQRARELAVQGANGIYEKGDRRGMAMEIDQILKHILTNANSKYKGNFLFSGFQKYTKPFEVIEGSVRGTSEQMITEIRYLGDNGKHLREVDTGEYVTVSKAGSEVYWAENFQIYSSVNTANFRLNQDSTILIDGNRIDFKAGDNAYAITDKINRSPAAVNASIDMVTGGLIIKSTKAHKVEISDIEGGTLMQDLGILEDGFAVGPDNYSSNATVFGGSVFDVLIGLRNAMLQDNMEDIGGRYLGAIDNAMQNLLFHTAESGALTMRLEYLTNRLTDDKMAYSESLAATEDIDIAEAITELKTLEFAHRAALSSLARLSQVSLMDFIR